MCKLNRKSTWAWPVVLLVVLCVVGTASMASAQHDAHQTPAESHAQMTHEDHSPADMHGEQAEGAHAEGNNDGPPHLPNALSLLSKKLPPEIGEKVEHFENPIFSMFMALLVTGFFIVLTGRLSLRNPGRVQMLIELFFGWLYDLFKSVLGEDARRYTPYLGTLFIFILVNNLFGMLPLGHSATSSFATTTFALGMLTFFYVQYIALKENGIRGYLFHMAGAPTCGLEWGFSALLFPLHLLGEFIKPISLSLRLFGNIFGEDALVATMVMLGTGIMYKLTGSQFVPGLPLQFPFYFLGLLSSTIQALVFTLLSTVYIALWLPHGDHDDYAEAHGH